MVEAKIKLEVMELKMVKKEIVMYHVYRYK